MLRTGFLGIGCFALSMTKKENASLCHAERSESISYPGLCVTSLIVMKKLKRLIAFLCPLFFSCGQPETEVIALVGDEKITAAELRDFAERREKTAIRVGTAIADTSDPLQQLIARRLLLLEARHGRYGR